jgi:hypothetical protein
MPVGTLQQRIRETGIFLDGRSREQIIDCTRPFFEARFTRLKNQRHFQPAIAPWMPYGDDGPVIPVLVDPSMSPGKVGRAIKTIFHPKGKMAASLLDFIKSEQNAVRSRRVSYWSRGNLMGGWFEKLFYPESFPEWPRSKYVRISDKDIIWITIAHFDHMDIPADPYAVKKALQRWKKKTSS